MSEWAHRRDEKKNYNMSINKRRTKAMAVGQFNVVFGQMGATQVFKKVTGKKRRGSRGSSQHKREDNIS